MVRALFLAIISSSLLPSRLTLSFSPSRSSSSLRQRRLQASAGAAAVVKLRRRRRHTLLSAVQAEKEGNDEAGTEYPVPDTDATTTRMTITGLYRYAVKGLSGDALPEVAFDVAGETFPDDRRFALLYQDRKERFLPGQWLHKENFLCAFTAPELLARLESSYRIVEEDDDDPRRVITIRERRYRSANADVAHEEGQVLLPETNLATRQGREQLSDFLTQQCGQEVTCVTGDDREDGRSNSKQTFQFGNTSSGVKKNHGNSRTIHIVNENTVKEVSEKLGIPLRATRFRPNVIISGPPAWSEFDWIGHTLRIAKTTATVDDNGTEENSHSSRQLRIRVISRTVRCRGVSIDPFDYYFEDKDGASTDHDCSSSSSGSRTLREVDIPGLLAKHFPEHGPYLGVYAVIESAPGTLSVGQDLLLEHKE